MLWCLRLRFVQLETGEIQRHKQGPENSMFFVALTALTSREHLGSPVSYQRVAAVSACLETFCFCGSLYPKNMEVLDK